MAPRKPASGPKRRTAEKPPPDPSELKRQGAGLHATGDGRFLVEQSANGWMVTDNERTNELGLPLVRGPFATLVEARDAVTAARSGPLPISNLAERIAAIPKQAPGSSRAARRPDRPTTPPAPLPPVLREFRSRDGDGLRALWEGVGAAPADVDDMRLRTFAQRNPGLFLVVAQGDEVIGAGLGGWDGRFGWLHLVAVVEAHRRGGLGTQLVRRLEAGLAAVGCRRVRVVDDGGPEGTAFWAAVGYQPDAAGYLSRDLEADPEGPGRTDEPPPPTRSG
ncbi:MAG: GNAT family N-acetyltransferase [Chloroflexota bacterium]|nr:MAG: GNAT family N-acetyltransferase [Chloroflexota bacterium]